MTSWFHLVKLFPWDDWRPIKCFSLIWSRKQRETFDFRGEWERLYRKGLHASTSFQSLRDGQPGDSKTRRISVFFMIFQLIMSLRLFVLIACFYDSPMTRSLGHFYFAPGGDMLPYLFEQAMVGVCGASFRFLVWYFEGKSGFMTDFVADENNIKESRPSFYFAFFLATVDPFIVNVLGMTFDIMLAIHTVLAVSDPSILYVLGMIVWTFLSCLQVCLIGYDCVLISAAAFLAADYMVLKTKQMTKTCRFFIRQISSVRSKTFRSERETIKCLLIVKLLNQHRALIKTLLDYKRQQSGVLFYMNLWSNPILGAMLYYLVFAPYHYIFFPTNLMAFLAVYICATSVQLKAGQLRS